MANLQYKTKHNLSPQGKAKVYFSCHPEDYEKCFETIADDILAIQDCSLWYCDTNTVKDDDFFADLEQMQLFVMPITTKLLSSDNDAIKIEFPFAIKNHIPVLPLMQEAGLEELFNRKCGDLQFLNKNNSDDTAIGYHEKLEKYLSSVLVGNELTKKVRAAFDAHIFLSYRKKDRKYAQELMRLIHNNEFCRDVAIWYDEFLTPGENFDDEIRRIIHDCDLFALTLSPSIAQPRVDENGEEHDNYIVMHEYPLARKLGKKILPADFKEVDHAELGKYEDLPQCIDAKSESDLEIALRDAFKSIALRANKDDPEHDFFIGLAYLDGIDVEVDYERALTLITCAAEHDVREAMEKLVHMYRVGKGVARDYKEAIHWQSKVVESLKLKTSPDSNTEDVLKLMSELWFLGDYWHDVVNEQEASRAYQYMLNIGVLHKKHGVDKAFRKKFLRYLSIAYEKAGNMQERIEEYDLALDNYRKALRIKRKLKNKRDLQSIKDLLNCYKRIGIIQKHRCQYYDAIKSFKKCISLSDVIYRSTGDISYVFIAILKIGEIYHQWGESTNNSKYITHAKDSLLQGITWAKQALQNDKLDDEALEYLSHYYNSLGMFTLDEAEKVKYHLAALGHIEESISISESLWKLQFKAMTLSLLSSATKDDYNAILKYEFESLGIRERIYNIDHNSYSLAHFAQGLINVGYANKKIGKIKTAQEYYNKAITLLTESEDETPVVKDALIGALYMLAFLDEERPNRELLERALSLSESLINNGRKDRSRLAIRDRILEVLSKAQ